MRLRQVTRALTALAWLTIRQAVRSRFLISIVILLLILLVSFPAVIKGDGTLEGQLRVLLSYTLGAASLVVGVATLWLACGAVANDIHDRRIHLVAIKPLPTALHWLGRWLGLVALNALLLALIGVAMIMGVAWSSHHAATANPDANAPTPTILAARERNVLELMGRIESDPVWAMKRELKRPVAQGELVYRFLTPVRDAEPIRGTWHVTTEDNVARASVPVRCTLDGINRVVLPGTALSGDVPLRLRFAIDPTTPPPTALVFHPEHPPELLTPAGGFTLNLTRSLLLILVHMALLAALGLTTGCMLSTPVSVFAASGVVIAVFVSQFFAFSSDPAHAVEHHHHGHHDHAEHGVEWAEPIARAGAAVMSPMTAFRLQGRLAAGVRVPWHDVGNAVVVLLVGYGGAVALLGMLALRKRELANPG